MAEGIFLQINSLIMPRSKAYFVFLLSFSPLFLQAQPLSSGDYRRAQSFLWENLHNKQVYNLVLTSGFYPDSSGMWFIDFDSSGKTFYEVSFPEIRVNPLFDHDRMRDSLSKALNYTVFAKKLPINQITYLSTDSLRLTIRGKDYLWDRLSYRVSATKGKSPSEPELSSLSPDKQWKAFPQNYNLALQSTATEDTFLLSHEGKQHYEYGSYYGWDDLMQGEEGKRPEHFQAYWSPNSQWLFTYICDTRQAEKMYLLDYSVDTLFRPQLYSYYRGSPGDSPSFKWLLDFTIWKRKRKFPFT